MWHLLNLKTRISQYVHTGFVVYGLLLPAFLISPASIYMPKVNNRNTRSCDKVWNQFKFKNKDFQMTSVLVCLLLTWAIFNIWSQCIYCWFWPGQCVVGKYFTNYYIFSKTQLKKTTSKSTKLILNAKFV